MTILISLVKKLSGENNGMEEYIVVTQELIDRIKLSIKNKRVQMDGDSEGMLTFTPKLPTYSSDKLVFTVTDIQYQFDCGREKALKILHLMFKYECSTQIGKEWYASEDGLRKFMEIAMAQKLTI